jgi:hypothetical protein
VSGAPSSDGAAEALALVDNIGTLDDEIARLERRLEEVRPS